MKIRVRYSRGSDFAKTLESLNLAPFIEHDHPDPTEPMQIPSEEMIELEELRRYKAARESEDHMRVEMQLQELGCIQDAKGVWFMPKAAFH
jgi:hypothetical protein